MKNAILIVVAILLVGGGVAAYLIRSGMFGGNSSGGAGAGEVTTSEAVAANDSKCSQLLGGADHADAATWLEGPTEQRSTGGVELQSVGGIVHSMNGLGGKAYVVKITKNGNVESAAALVIELPTDADKRAKVFTAEGPWRTKYGHSPSHDVGQKYVYFSLE